MTLRVRLGLFIAMSAVGAAWMLRAEPSQQSSVAKVVTAEPPAAVALEVESKEDVPPGEVEGPKKDRKKANRNRRLRANSSPDSDPKDPL